jgi:hypothetical protein
MNTTPPLAVNEQKCAEAIGISVARLRKDRRGKRLIPFYRLGGRILYSPDRVQAALTGLEEGGTRPKSRREKAA